MGSVGPTRLSDINNRGYCSDFGGTVNGKKIDLLSADHHNNPDLVAEIANQWFAYNSVDAIVDVPTSSVALTVQASRRSHTTGII